VAENRLEYQRGELTEWYVNQADGLEQGFTFARRPAGAGEGEPLVIALALTGGFKPVLAPEGDAVIFESEAGEVSRYKGLRAWDARGREVASRLDVRDQEIRLLVNDRDAEYPLVVDPTATTTTLTPSGAACLPVPVGCGASSEGQELTLTAKVSPPPPNGEIVTFYNGVPWSTNGITVLGTAKLSGGTGTATFNTTLLLAGTSLLGELFLTAHYEGDVTFSGSVSAILGHFIVDLPATTFAPPAGFNVGTNPLGLAIGNFNKPGDLNADVAVANLAGGVTILLGDGLGHFTQPAASPFSAGSGPRAVAVGDFNEDGLPDLAVVNYTEGVSVLPGKGSAGLGGFGAFTQLTTGSFPEGIAVGDFNNDGHADLAITNNGDGTVTVLLGDGTGHFTLALGSPFTVGLGPAGIAVGDFNEDGKADLAVVNDFDGNVRILLGDGTGSFTLDINPASILTVGRSSNGSQTIAAGDFNLDGHFDLAVTTDFGVSILLGVGDGTFNLTAGSPIPADSFPNAVAVADFNGDQIPDLAVTNGFTNDVSILIGNGDGTFQPAANFGVGFLPSSIAAGEFNGDMITDLVVADFDSDVQVLLGKEVTIAAAPPTTQSTQVNTAFALPLVVTTTPPTKGLTVTFIAPPSTGASGTFAGGVNTAVTDATGTATSPTFTANSNKGIYNVTAVLGFGAKALFTLTNLGVKAIATVGGSPQSTKVSTPFPIKLQARVTDQNGNGIAGISVTFTAPSAAGASGTFSNGLTTDTFVTDATGVALDGAAAPIFTANGNAGTYVVTAIAAGVPGEALFVLTNAGPPASIVPIGTPQSAGVGSPFTSPLAVRVTDLAGNPVQGTSVKFTVIPAGSGAAGTFTTGSTFTGTTDSTGLVSPPATTPPALSNFTANSIGGTYTVTAAVVGGPPLGTIFALTNLSGIILPGSQSLKVGDSVSFPVQLGSPAPAGGIAVALTSSDSTVVNVVPQYILIPGGTMTSRGMMRLDALGKGTVTITAAAVGFQSVQITVTVTQ